MYSGTSLRNPLFLAPAFAIRRVVNYEHHLYPGNGKSRNKSGNKAVLRKRVHVQPSKDCLALSVSLKGLTGYTWNLHQQPLGFAGLAPEQYKIQRVKVM